MPGAEHFTHHVNQLQHPVVVDVVVDSIGFFFRAQNVFFTKDCQMLRDIALRGAYLFDDVLHADRVGAQNAQNLQS